MKTIPLSRGMLAIVDDEDYERLCSFNWFAYEGNSTFYAQRHKLGVNRNESRPFILMHREILNVVDPSILVDHIDGNGLNNQKSNLRECNRSQNKQNGKVYKCSKTGYRGVTYRKDLNKFRSKISFNGKEIHLGYFKTAIEAAQERDKKAIELHGEFARATL